MTPPPWLLEPRPSVGAVPELLLRYQQWAALMSLFCLAACGSHGPYRSTEVARWLEAGEFRRLPTPALTRC